MTDFLLAFPNISPPADFRFSYSLGTGYIHTHLRRNGVRSEHFLGNGSTNISDLVDAILQYKPKIMGFTCFDGSYYLIKVLSENLKLHRPDLPIIVGGPAPTFSDRLILEDCPEIDICVRGEGEVTALEIVNSLKNGTDLSSVLGVSYRDKGQIIRTPERPYPKKIDMFPSPYLENVIPPSYGEDVGLLTTRGCGYRCSFCLFAAMSGYKVRYHDIERLIAELKVITNAASSHKLDITVHDDSFAVNPRRVRKFCERLIAEGINEKLEFSAELRADTVSAELLKQMYQAGFRKIAFGLESGVPEILHRIAKVRTSPDSNNYKPEKAFLELVKDRVQQARDIGFLVELSIILGLPGETYEQGCETLEYVRSAHSDSYAHNYLEVRPGTSLYRDYQRYGIKAESTLAYGGLLGSLSRTFHTYDVGSVAPLENAFCGTQAPLLGNMLAGSYPDQSSIHPADVMFDHPTDPPPVKVLSCLSSKIGISTKAYLQLDHFSEAFYLEVRKNLVNARSPIFNMYYLRSQEDFRLTDGYRFESFPVYYDHIKVPFGNEIKPLADRNRQIVVLAVNTKEAVGSLISVADEAEKSGYYSLPSSLVGTSICIEDECRWSSSPCPALKLPKIIVGDNGTIRPCMHGEVIGTVADQKKELSEFIISCSSRAQKERGCETCPVSDTCSKCVYTHPVSPDEYCRIRKQYPHITNLTHLIRMIRNTEFEGLDGGPLVVPINNRSGDPLEHSRPTMFRNTLMPFQLGEQFFVFDSENLSVRPVSQTLYDLFQTCKTNKNERGVVDNLMQDYGVSLEDARSSLEDVTRLCGELGWLHTDATQWGSWTPEPPL